MIGGISQGSCSELQGSWAAAQAPDVELQCPRTKFRGQMRVPQAPRTVDLGTGCLQRLCGLPVGLFGCAARALVKLHTQLAPRWRSLAQP